MIYITGDTHREFERLSLYNFPQQTELTRNDYLIICGDFSGVWSYLFETKSEKELLDSFTLLRYTILFVDGNHENHTRLKEYPRVKFHGGMAHKIRQNVYHLMRGYVFDFDGKKFFTFGGAQSHDIQDGILRRENYELLIDMLNDYKALTNQGKYVRMNEISWWKEELPNSAEMKRGIENLKKVDFKVDFVITHCPPREICKWCGYYDSDKLLDYFDKLLDMGLKFDEWWSGHLHRNEYNLFSKYNIIFKEIVRIA
jgi:hypothetical protein